MKSFIYISLLSVALFFSCSDDDDKKVGNPTIEIKSEFINIMFGDNMPFKVNVSDEVPLSTLKAKLYYGEQLVSEVVTRTKTNGEYEGEMFIPFLKDTPNAKAKLEFVLQNINFTITSTVIELPLTRPQYPYLTFVTEGKEYQMKHIDGYNYELTETLPRKIKGYIKSPTITPIGSEITFGWEDNAITQGSINDIPFSYLADGEYTISFNTQTYAAAPFIIAYAINDVVMERIDDDNFKIDLSLTKEQEIKVEGIDDFGEWWIDQDFFAKDGDKLTFNAIDGKYRISADFKLKYLKVEAMIGNEMASLQPDGTGALWIIGDSQGKPSFANTGWDTNKAACMAPMGDGKYKISFVAGETIVADRVNFIIAHLKGWNAFKPETLTVESDLIMIGTGKNGVDNGNIALAKDKTLTVGKIYEFVVDVSAGIDKAVLTVSEK